jgi:hypothetical protein
MKKKMSKAEREALDARTEESIRRLRALAEKAQAEIDAKRAQQST